MSPLWNCQSYFLMSFKIYLCWKNIQNISVWQFCLVWGKNLLCFVTGMIQNTEICLSHWHIASSYSFPAQTPWYPSKVPKGFRALLLHALFLLKQINLTSQNDILSTCSSSHNNTQNTFNELTQSWISCWICPYVTVLLTYFNTIKIFQGKNTKDFLRSVMTRTS